MFLERAAFASRSTAAETPSEAPLSSRSDDQSLCAIDHLGIEAGKFPPRSDRRLVDEIQEPRFSVFRRGS